MKDEEKIITKVDKLPDYPPGRHRWTVHFSDGSSARTRPGAEVAQDLDVAGYRGVPVMVTFQESGFITDIQLTVPVVE